MPEIHHVRIARQRAAYREAHARFVKRLRDAPEDAVHRVPDGGGWSAAQIGWHVAAVDERFAGLVSGARPGAQLLPDGVMEKPWAEIVAAIPGKIQAGKAVTPPADARRDEVIASLEDSAASMDAALAGLAEDRGVRYAITHPVVGTVTLAQIGDWATAHVIRHNAQAKRVLGG